ncbi:MAG: ABC transporter permease [Kiritimatiellae bacterium]|nr:ABC transporter permease [Kiritimatiellia bacterium]
MAVRLALNGILRGKARFLSAALGVAAAVGAVVFTSSLAATNDRQSLAIAERLLGEVEVAADARVARFSLDYRPDGRVMQGPPMAATVATRPGVDGIVVTKALFAQRRLEAPPPGGELALVGKNGAYRLKISDVLDWDRPLRGYPNAFVSPQTAAAIGEDWQVFGVRTAAELAPMFKTDDGRRMDYAKPLMLAAAVLTALALLVNSLLLSVESNRRTIAVLRTVGATAFTVVGLVAAESFLAAAAGWLLGVAGAAASLVACVAADPAGYPAGAAFDSARFFATLCLLPPVAFAAILFALRPALSVRPMDSAALRPRRGRRGMAIAFAFGFASFVAVEVWGSSLMRAFVPSAEWPDAIVSLLPGGVSAFDIGKLRDIPGVRRISELLPLQVAFPGESPRPGDRRSPARAMGPNALFLAAEWLPDFKFVEGDRDSAVAAIARGAVVITEMMSRARGLHLGDELFDGLAIAGVVDLNWHMVTSRGLVRGLDGAPVMTDGPVFASFDTVESLDRRPAPMVKMTHLWVEYEPEFLEKNGVFKAGRIVEAEIASRLGASEDYTVRLHARDEIADGTLAHGSDLIGRAARVPFVFLAILAIGFVAMLVAEADSRRREFAVLRAVGATRPQIAMLLVRSAVSTAVVGVAIAVPAGSLVGWLFTLVTGSAWPGLPRYFVFSVRVVLEGAAGALVFALAFAVPTAIFLMRRDAKR